jgi:hypothetical protein
MHVAGGILELVERNTRQSTDALAAGVKERL